MSTSGGDKKIGWNVYAMLKSRVVAATNSVPMYTEYRTRKYEILVGLFEETTWGSSSGGEKVR